MRFSRGPTNRKKRPSKDPVPNLHFNAQHEAASHFAEVNGLKVYYETHGEGRRLVLVHGGDKPLMCRGSGNRPRRPDGAVLSGFIEAVVYPFRGDTADVQWNWPRAPAQPRLPADRRGAHWEVPPGWCREILVVFGGEWLARYRRHRREALVPQGNRCTSKARPACLAESVRSGWKCPDTRRQQQAMKQSCRL